MKRPMRFRYVGSPAAPSSLQDSAWLSLSAAERLRLREQYAHYLDSIPQCCALNRKATRFCNWLKESGMAG